MPSSMSSCGDTTVEVLLVVSISAEVVVCATAVVTAAVVSGEPWESVSLVEEASKGPLDVMDVVGLNKLTVVLFGLVVHLVVFEVSVALTVDAASSTSGLTAEGTVVPDRVLECSGVADDVKLSGQGSSSGAGGALDEMVYLLPGVVPKVELVETFTA